MQRGNGGSFAPPAREKGKKGHSLPVASVGEGQPGREATRQKGKFVPYKIFYKENLQLIRVFVGIIVLKHYTLYNIIIMARLMTMKIRLIIAVILSK